jgi:hypothetical protein
MYKQSILVGIAATIITALLIGYTPFQVRSQTTAVMALEQTIIIIQPN